MSGPPPPSLPIPAPPSSSTTQQQQSVRKLPPGAVAMPGMFLPPPTQQPSSQQEPPTPTSTTSPPPRLTIPPQRDFDTSTTTPQDTPQPSPSHNNSSFASQFNMNQPPPTPTNQHSLSSIPSPTHSNSIPTETPPPPQYSKPIQVVVSTGTIQHNSVEAAVYRSLENGVAQQHQQLQQNQSISIEDDDNLLTAIPTVFGQHQMSLQPPQRPDTQIFLCGPVGIVTKKEKDYKARFAVLYRDRIEILAKYNDVKNVMVWPLTGCLTQSNREADNSQFITITNLKGEILSLRVEISPDILDPRCNHSSAPTLDGQHKAWLSAIRARVSNLEFLSKCKSNGIQYPDERLLLLYDAQYKSPNCMKMINTYGTAELRSKLPSLPPGVIANVQHPITKEFHEGFCSILAGPNFTPETLQSLCSLYSDPDAVQIYGVKFYGGDFNLETTGKLLMALAHNSNSQLVELDLSGANCIEQSANKPNAELLELLTKFLTSSNLINFQRLIIKKSGLTSAFMNAWLASLQTSTKPIIAPITVLDFSSNRLNDETLPTLIGFFAYSETICNNLQHLNLSFNQFTDLEQLATWLTFAKPDEMSSYTLYQQTHPPFKPIHLKGLYLQGLGCTDKSFIALSKSLLWHIKLKTLDLSNPTRLQDAGVAAITQMLQINESIEIVKFGNNFKLDLNGLTTLRLMYRQRNAYRYPELFASQQHGFPDVVLASELL